MDLEKNNVESVEASCCGRSNDDPVPDSVHILIIRIIGIVTLCFGFIEIGLGAGVFDFFREIHLGAWWVGMMCLFTAVSAVISLSRGWCIATCVLSWVSLIFCIAGAASDGLSSIHFGTLTACSTSSSQFGSITNYGMSKDYPSSNACLSTADSYAANACYCVSEGGRFCGVYRLGYNAVEYGDQNCGHVLTTYPNALRASTALCVLCFILVLALGVTTSVVLCCASKSPLIQPRPSIKADFIPPSQESEADEIGVVGNSVRIDG